MYKMFYNVRYRLNGKSHCRWGVAEMEEAHPKHIINLFTSSDEGKGAHSFDFVAFSQLPSDTIIDVTDNDYENQKLHIP